MKETTATLVAGAVLMALGSTGAIAGGIERADQGIDVMFEPGTVFTAGMSYVAPSIEATPSALTGNIAEPYLTFSAGFKISVTDQIDLGFVIDQPYGADISYKGALTGMADATLSATAFTALARYHVNDNISVHAGVRLQSVSANVSLPLVGGYTLDLGSDTGLGYVIGAAYEKPEIALRAAITYNSAITNTMTGTEFGLPTSFAQQTPQSINVDFQTGIAANTLIFASARWVDWSSFTVAPPLYPFNPLVSYGGDTISYELGIGRKLSDTFSVAASLGYEAPLGGVFSDLGPTDGYWSAGLGGSWQATESLKFSGGLRYISLGDANGGALTLGSPFTGNHAVAGGLSITSTF